MPHQEAKPPPTCSEMGPGSGLGSTAEEGWEAPAPARTRNPASGEEQSQAVRPFWLLGTREQQEESFLCINQGRRVMLSFTTLLFSNLRQKNWGYFL